MGIRNYSNTGQTSTLSAGIGATDVSITLTGYAGDPSPPFTAALARGTATEEIVLVTAVAGSTVTVTRGYDGTAAQAQGAGNTFQEVVVAQDFREANNHVNATSAAHGITGGFVGTTDTQTLTNKTLTSPALSSANLTGTSSATILNVTTLTVSGVTTLANVSVGGTLGVTGLLTASGGVTVPTGFKATLTDAPATGTDAANKTYVDNKTKTSAQISDATAAPTASTVIIRDASGRAQVATPAATGDIATKGYADALGTNANTASTIARRDSAGRTQFVDPAAAQDAATKNYVDNSSDTAWHAATLQNSWVNYAAGYQPAQYRKLRNGQVELQGLIKNGTATSGTVLLTLPAGYRPANILMFPELSSPGAGTQLARIEVHSDGTVVAVDGVASGFLTLNLTFYGEL